MSYTSILHVQSSKDSRILREISKIKPRLARTTGYHVKLIEKPLSKMFSTSVVSSKYHRKDCILCSNPDLKGNILCQVKSVVYEGVCDRVYRQDTSKNHEGHYVS